MNGKQIWEVNGIDNLDGMVFAQCSSKEKAEKAIEILEKNGFENMLCVKQSNLRILIINDERKTNMTEKTFDTIVSSLINDKIESEKYNKNGINDIHIKNIDSALKELKELKEIKKNNLLKENLIKQFNYCNAIAEDILQNNKSKKIQEYAKKFAEIESPLAGGSDADWIRINWGDIYIFLCDNGDIGYQVDPLCEYGGELIDMWNCTKEDFVNAILSLEEAPIIRDGIIYFEADESVGEPPMYIPMK